MNASSQVCFQWSSPSLQPLVSITFPLYRNLWTRMVKPCCSHCDMTSPVIELFENLCVPHVQQPVELLVFSSKLLPRPKFGCSLKACVSRERICISPVFWCSQFHCCGFWQYRQPSPPPPVSLLFFGLFWYVGCCLIFSVIGFYWWFITDTHS